MSRYAHRLGNLVDADGTTVADILREVDCRECRRDGNTCPDCGFCTACGCACREDERPDWDVRY